MEKTCRICSNKNIEQARFCTNCGCQLNCLNCNEELLADANNCFSCGTAVSQKETNNTNNTALNTIDFRQTKDERTIKVTFTNDVAKEVRESIMQMSADRLSSLKSIGQPNNGFSKNDVEKDTDEEEIEDTEAEDVDNTKNTTPNSNDNYPHLNDIELNLECSEGEWILLYAFYLSNHGTKTFSRVEVFEKYKDKRKTDARIKNFAVNWNNLFRGDIATIKDGEIKITSKGIQRIKSLIDNRDSKTVRKKSNKKKKEGKENNIVKGSSKNKLPKTSSLSLLSSLNLNPDKGKSLKDFYSSYRVSNAFPEKNLIIIYYLERILKEKNIGINHVYTCYKQLKLKIPGNLYQSLVDTKNRKGWIDTTDINNLKVPVAGENHIEHDMLKA